MRKFVHLEGIAASMPQDNIDTDKILPGEYLKTVSRAGLGRVLFARLRYLQDGSERPDFVLNQEPWRSAGILVAGDNFGCGSSREHAPWALTDFGISAILAKSFADIFYNNCFKNGILPIVLDASDHSLVQRLVGEASSARLRIDLPRQMVTASSGREFRFDIEPGRKAGLIEGRDEIAETLTHQARILDWRRRSAVSNGVPGIVLAQAKNGPASWGQQAVNKPAI